MGQRSIKVLNIASISACNRRIPEENVIKYGVSKKELWSREIKVTIDLDSGQTN